MSPSIFPFHINSQFEAFVAKTTLEKLQKVREQAQPPNHKLQKRV